MQKLLTSPFEKGKWYKHKQMVDVAFRVDSVFEDLEETIKLGVTWFNCYYKTIIDIDEVSIKKKDLDKWNEYQLK